MKKALLFLFCILVLFFFYLLFIDKKETSPKASSVIAQTELNEANSSDPILQEPFKAEEKESAEIDLEQDEEPDSSYIESEECTALKRDNPSLYQEYNELMAKYGLSKEDLLEETSYNNLPISTLTQLSESRDLKAQYILGIYYVWKGGIGINYFDMLKETAPYEDNDAASTIKKHELNIEMVNRGQNLLMQSAINGKFFALQEVIVGQRFKLKKLSDAKKHREFHHEFVTYMEYVDLVNFVFAASTKKAISLSYYDKHAALENLRETYPEMVNNMELPAYRKGNEVPTIKNWKQARLDSGFLDMHFDIGSELANFSEKMETHCWGL